MNSRHTVGDVVIVGVWPNDFVVSCRCGFRVVKRKFETAERAAVEHVDVITADLARAS